MADYRLTAAPALGGYHRAFDGVTLREMPDLALVALALPRGGEAAATGAIEAAFGTALPESGHTALSSDGTERLLRLGPDQAFVLMTRSTPDAEAFIAARLGGAAYVTDQSDAFVALEISGPRSRAALERICPLDLHPKVFSVGDVARTVMEHLGVMVLRTGQDSFLLLSARSSARSFLHAVEVSIANTG